MAPHEGTTGTLPKFHPAGSPLGALPGDSVGALAGAPLQLSEEQQLTLHSTLSSLHVGTGLMLSRSKHIL